MKQTIRKKKSVSSKQVKKVNASASTNKNQKVKRAAMMLITNPNIKNKKYALKILSASI